MIPQKPTSAPKLRSVPAGKKLHHIRTAVPFILGLKAEVSRGQIK
jgi:hypothetical protein